MQNTTSTPENQSGSRRDIHQHVTDTIIAQLEAGCILWQRPWNGSDNYPLSMPKNFTTGRQYQGINVLLLWVSAMQNEYSTSHWASFKQWQENKETVRKGETGTLIVYYDTIERDVEGEVKKIPFLKSSYVFNRSQLKSYAPETSQHAPFEDRAPLIEDFIANTGACIHHEDYGACYIGATDKIYMPYPDNFLDSGHRTKQEAYYSVIMHELTHWTGHPKRLNRKLGKSFGDETYAMEELVAELGAAFLCADLSITNETKEDHAGYIANWLQVLKDNKQHIIKAASEASKAAQFLHRLQPLQTEHQAESPQPFLSSKPE